MNTSLTTLHDGHIDEITEHVIGKIARIEGSKARRLCWAGVSHEMRKSQVSTARDQVFWRNGFERERLCFSEWLPSFKACWDSALRD